MNHQFSYGKSQNLLSECNADPRKPVIIDGHDITVDFSRSVLRGSMINQGYEMYGLSILIKKDPKYYYQKCHYPWL